jgi:hypothetical protein
MQLTGPLRPCDVNKYSSKDPQRQKERKAFLQNVFNMVPFGLSMTDFISSKGTRYVVKFMRSKNVKVFMNLDDGLNGGSSYSEACKVSLLVREQVEKLVVVY